MSNAIDFVIENGVLTGYHGAGGEIVIPDEVTECRGVVFCGFEEPFELTLSPNMKCNSSDLLSEGISVLNIPAGTQFKCSSFGPNYSQFYVLLREINVDPENESCASKDGILYSKNMKTLYSCPAAYEGKVEIPNTVKKIATHAFDGCYKIKEVVIPASVKTIGERAFMDCKSLKKVVLQNEKTIIEPEAFLRCTKITTAGSAGTSSDKKGYSFEFPWSESIPDNAFSGMKKLKSVVLPDTIKSIGKNAFKGCKGMETISMPVGVKYEKKCFKDCKKLSITETEDGVKTPDSANDFVVQNGTLVSYKGKDKDIVIPDHVTVIGRKAFYWNTEIESVVIPESVTEIQQEAFNWCHKLQSFTILGKIKKIGANVFDSFYNKKDTELYICSVIPVSAYSKSAQETVLYTFVCRFTELDPSTDVYKNNLIFIGTHLKQPKGYKQQVYHYLIENEELRHAVLNAKAIPAKDLKWLISVLQEENQTEMLAEVLEYQNLLLSDTKVKKALEKAEKKAEEKALSPEMSVSDWRKLLKFSYENGDIVIKEVLMKDPVTVIPDHIGARKVRIIDGGAFAYYLKKGEKELWSPDKIILPEGIEEIRRGAFDCAENTEIFFPSTVKSLPKDCFCAVENLTLHLPASITEIADQLEYDSGEPAFKSIYAPAGTYAEQYAIEHNIPFVAE